MPSLVRKKSYGFVKVFWLDRNEAVERLRKCAKRLVELHPEINSVGLFGSLARGEATPRSDADILILLDFPINEPFPARSARYQSEFDGVGIGVEIFCYTLEERLCNRFASQAADSAIWLAVRAEPE